MLCLNIDLLFQESTW